MESFTNTYAPGWPGLDPRGNASRKTGAGTSLNPHSHVWFTTQHGILNEIYYPRVDYICIKDIGFLISDGEGFFSEEKIDAKSTLEHIEGGVPAYRFTNTCKQKKYRIEKEVLTDPFRDSLIQQAKFTALEGDDTDYHLYVIMAPQIMNAGAGNTAWCGEYKGVEMLFAERESTAIAMACSIPFKERSVGFVGVSDGWQDISKNKKLTQQYQRAENGNVAACGEIDLEAVGNKPFIVSVGFGLNPMEAGQRALASIKDDFERVKSFYIKGWLDFQESIQDYSHGLKDGLNLFRTSAAAVITHHAPQFPGGYIASLSVPWGFAKGDSQLGGYHLVWPRDLVEVAGGMLAAGMDEEALNVLRFLRLVQEPDGHWLQNMWLDGSSHWGGIQLGETAFPVLLVNMLLRFDVLNEEQLDEYVPMLRMAVRYLVQNGPCSQQDRWEENAGYSPFTLAVEIAALLAAADILEKKGDREAADYLRETADIWNENIEAWTYDEDTDLSEQLGIEGHYIRIAPPSAGETSTKDDDIILIKNLPDRDHFESSQIVSADALALVRFGLRRADDPRILNTLKVIDELLKVETPYGDSWHRYNDDGYGEHEDGSPFDGTGIGRAWPLLTGERAHYELARGNKDRAEELLEAMGNFSNEGGMISEQIWDSDDIPEKELFPGKPSGSAMPLVWAHSEYMKLCRSIHDEDVFDMPLQTQERYIKQGKTSDCDFWRFNRKVSSISSKKKKLRIEANDAFILHWSADGWETVQDTDSNKVRLGMHILDLDITSLKAGNVIKFTFYWPEFDKWEERDFEVEIK
jgi:glucoamylase